MGVKLDILNGMLAAIGSSAIVTDTGNHPNLLRAAPILDWHNRTVQSRGHWFNTDRALTLSPNGSNEFVVPGTTLKVDTTDDRSVYVRRGTRMYDPVLQTYAITAVDTIDVDVVLELDYDDLPHSAANYIRALAISEMVLNFDADSLTVKARASMERQAMEAFNHERRANRNVSLRDNPTYARIMYGAFRHGAQPNPLYIGG